MTATPLLELTPAGLYCPAGDFHVDPWSDVPRAVITHAHADHARPGSGAYLAAESGAAILRRRLGADAPIEVVPFGVDRTFGQRACVSLHPAGHCRGSAQVRVEVDGRVAVVTGDVKAAADPTCAGLTPIACDELICEATFALPIFCWRPTDEVVDELLAWWDECAARGVAAVLGVYALGKAQRVLAEVGARRAGEVSRIWAHGAVVAMNAAYAADGCPLPPAQPVAEAPDGHDWGGALVLAPPSALGSRWMRRFKGASVALASGWMRVRGNRRWRGVDRGFALSDHADWPALLALIDATGAQAVYPTHGSSAALARYLRETRGLFAEPLESRFEGESE